MNMIEKMARAMLAIRVERTDETWQRYRHPESWRLFEEDARAALQAMLEPSEGIFEKMMQSYADSIKLSNGECISPDAYWLRLDGFSGMIRAALEEK